MILGKLPTSAISELIQTRLNSGKLVRSGTWLHLPDHRIILSSAEQMPHDHIKPWLLEFFDRICLMRRVGKGHCLRNVDLFCGEEKLTVHSDTVRKALLVEQSCFKPGWAIQLLPGGFDSHFFPSFLVCIETGSRITRK